MMTNVEWRWFWVGFSALSAFAGSFLYAEMAASQAVGGGEGVIEGGAPQ